MIVRTTPLAFALAILLAWVLFLGVLSDRVELFVAAIPLACALGSVTMPIDRAPLNCAKRFQRFALPRGSGLA